jgi:hypothetical protein
VADGTRSGSRIQTRQQKKEASIVASISDPEQAIAMAIASE